MNGRAISFTFNLVTTPYIFIRALAVTIASTIKYYTIGDLYSAYKDPEKLMEELAQRAKKSGTNVGIGHLGPAWQNQLPKFVYIAGNDRNVFCSISGYGELATNYDPGSHRIFNHVAKIIGHPAIINMHGAEALAVLKRMKPFLIGKKALEDVYEYTPSIFNDLFPSEFIPSYPEQVTYAVLKILSKCLFGVPTPERKDITRLMEINRLIAKPWPSGGEIASAHRDLKHISSEITGDSLDSIAPDKLVALEIDLHNPAVTHEQKLNNLREINIAGSFIAGTNLVDMIMKTLVELSKNNQVRSELGNEINNERKINYTSLNQLPYLHCVFLEAQRLFSPSVLARQTSRKTTLSVKDTQGKDNNITVPAYSYLFAPIRPKHMDADLWENPWQFDPSRFENDTDKTLEKMLVTFSDGIRGCPARFGFTEIIFKAIIEEFIKRDLIITLSKTLENIDIFAFNTSWTQDYDATVSQNRR